VTDAPPDDQDARRRARRWWAALVLAACYGLSAFFITGDPGKGFVVTLFLIVLFVLLFVFFPRLVDTRRPLASYYLAALAVLFGPLVLLATGQHRTPWDDLQRAWATGAAAPAGLDAGPEIVLVEPVDEFMVRPHSFNSATAIFGEQGVYLGPPWPLRLVYRPLWLPVDALAGCRASGLDTLYTSVALAGARTRVEVLDPREEVLAWCRQRGLTEG
jgi:hypothetical protein